MKRVALGLLAGAALLYTLASWLRPMHPAWGYVAAFSEAAMVGAIADWFAVVALFRHPLGLPIPHTAIIPSNKDRIGENLANFIVANFLSTAQVLEKLKRFDAAGRLANWLANPDHADKLAQHTGAVLRYALVALDDERVRQFFRATTLEALNRLDVSRLAGQWLGMLTHEQRHQPLQDALLRKLAQVLDNEALRNRLAELIAAEVKYLRYVGLDNVAGRYATTKLITGVTRLVGEMAEDPAHPLRAEFDGFMLNFVQRLQHDENLRQRVEDLKDQLLANPALGSYLVGLWSDIVQWMQVDLQREQSVLRTQVATATRVIGEKLQADAGIQAWINEQLLAVAPAWIERYREDIRRYIVARVGDWNTQEMTQELERNIGRDLQFIRINGTLVGGLVGLAIHTLTELAQR